MTIEHLLLTKYLQRCTSAGTARFTVFSLVFVHVMWGLCAAQVNPLLGGLSLYSVIIARLVASLVSLNPLFPECADSSCRIPFLLARSLHLCHKWLPDRLALRTRLLMRVKVPGCMNPPDLFLIKFGPTTSTSNVTKAFEGLAVLPLPEFDIYQQMCPWPK